MFNENEPRMKLCNLNCMCNLQIPEFSHEIDLVLGSPDDDAEWARIVMPGFSSQITMQKRPNRSQSFSDQQQMIFLTCCCAVHAALSLQGEHSVIATDAL